MPSRLQWRCPSQRACHVQAAFLTQFKLLGTYILPVVDVNFAATLQSTPGPVLVANRLSHQRGDHPVIWAAALRTARRT